MSYLGALLTYHQLKDIEFSEGLGCRPSAIQFSNKLQESCALS